MCVGAAGFVRELVADGFPGLPAIAGPLHDLPEPAARLRRIQSIRIGGRAFHVVNLPATEMRTADVPFRPLAVRRQDERPLACANQYSYAAHYFSSFSTGWR